MCANGMSVLLHVVELVAERLFPTPQAPDPDRPRPLWVTPAEAKLLRDIVRRYRDRAGG